MPFKQQVDDMTNQGLLGQGNTALKMIKKLRGSVFLEWLPGSPCGCGAQWLKCCELCLRVDRSLIIIITCIIVIISGIIRGGTEVLTSSISASPHLFSGNPRDNTGAWPGVGQTACQHL